MKRIAILTALILAAVSAFGQAARVDIPLQTAGPSVPISGGPLPQALWVANSAAYLCAHPSATLAACQAAPITTYTDSTEGTTCPTATPLVQLPGNTCTAATGTTANVGFWYGGGLFDYWIVSSYGAYGPFSVSSGDLPLTGGTLTGALNGTSASFSGTATAAAVNAVVNPCSFTGATADVKLTAALATIPTGGTVDASCFGATNPTISNTVTILDGQTIRFSPATHFVPGNDSVQPLAFSDSSQILGDFYWDVTARLTWNNSAVVNAGGISSVSTHIDRIHCIGIVKATGATDTNGSCLTLSGTASTSSVIFLVVDGIEVWGLHSGVKMLTTDGGWVNGNNLANVNCTDTLHCFDIEPTGTIAHGTQVSSNNFPFWSSEYLMPGAGTPQSGQVPIYIVPTTGSGQTSLATSNHFSSGNLFDYPAGTLGSPKYIVTLGAQTYRNQIEGALCVQTYLLISDNGIENNYYDEDPGCGIGTPGYINTTYPLYDTTGLLKGYLTATSGNVLPGDTEVTTINTNVQFGSATNATQTYVPVYSAAGSRLGYLYAGANGLELDVSSGDLRSYQGGGGIRVSADGSGNLTIANLGSGYTNIGSNKPVISGGGFCTGGSTLCPIPSTAVNSVGLITGGPVLASGVNGSGTVATMSQTCTTGSITPSSSAGGTATGTCTLGTSATGHTGIAVASDGTVQGNVIPQVSVNATTATVTVTSILAGSPTAKTFNVTVF